MYTIECELIRKTHSHFIFQKPVRSIDFCINFKGNSVALPIFLLSSYCIVIDCAKPLAELKYIYNQFSKERIYSKDVAY